ncbi:MAG: hypothetical protein ACJAWV_001321 [Flammeovirgaceae bacterium]|jgi:hypothetical protein
MKIKHYILLFALISATISCESDKKKTQEDIKKVETKEISTHEEEQVKLNNGERWLANAETTEGINNMIELMNSFTEKENVESYKVLVDSLNSEFNMIFKKCTMKGEAHNQLHNYLVPMKLKFTKMPSADLNECKTSFEDLNKHLAVYEEYFQ